MTMERKPHLTKRQEEEMAWLTHQYPELTFRQRVNIVRAKYPAEGHQIQAAFKLALYADASAATAHLPDGII